MPRFEKAGRGKDALFEIARVGDRVYVAEGERATGSTAWEFAERGRKSFSFPDEAAAIAQYDKRIAEITKKKYVATSDDAPHALEIRMRNEVAKVGRVPEGAPTELRARFAKAGHLTLKDRNGAVFSIALDGFNLLIERDGKKSTRFFPDLETALTQGALELMIVRELWGYDG